jgi:uncharacterized membrane protein
MKRILTFLRTTMVGGLLFLVPIIVLVMILGKAVALAHRLVDPLAARIPFESVIGLRTPVLLAITLLVLFCFLAGFFARSALAQKIVRGLETAVLSNVPGYEFIKGTLAGTLGAQPEHAHEVVLARIEDAWQLAFRIEQLEGGHVAVFVPGAPSPQSGSVYFMTEDRIKAVNIPPASALKSLRRLGAGSTALLRGISLGAAPEK